MKRILPSGEVEFRPSITRASLPLAATAVLVPAVTGLLVRLGQLDAWVLGTALAGSVLVFGTSFLMPFLRKVHVKRGEISGPSGYGVNTLRLERLDLARSRLHADGRAVVLVDDLGSELCLSPMDLTPEEIREALIVFGLDPNRLLRT